MSICRIGKGSLQCWIFVNSWNFVPTRVAWPNPKKKYCFYWPYKIGIKDFSCFFGVGGIWDLSQPPSLGGQSGQDKSQSFFSENPKWAASLNDLIMWWLLMFTILHWRLQTVIPPWIRQYKKEFVKKIFHLKQLSCKELHSHRPRSGSFGRGHLTLEDRVSLNLF